MSDAFRQFMVELASDVAKLTHYMEDPAAAMADAGLSSEDQAILSGGDQNRIYAYLKGGELPPPSPVPPPPQLPTVVAAMQMQGQPAAAAGAAMPGAMPAGVSPPMITASMFFSAVPIPQWSGQPAYYVMQWPTWPTR